MYSCRPIVVTKTNAGKLVGMSLFWPYKMSPQSRIYVRDKRSGLNSKLRSVGGARVGSISRLGRNDAWQMPKKRRI